MFNLIFGLCFAMFSLVFLVAFISSGVVNEGFTFSLLFPLTIIGIFLIVGLGIFIRGVKQIITNRKTSLRGEECYAILKEIMPTGSRINGMPELKGTFLVYILSLNKTEMIEEIIGFNMFKYKVNDYVKVKYYDGDINVLEIVGHDLVPSNVRRKLGESDNTFQDEIIQVNGHTYKRID